MGEQFGIGGDELPPVDCEVCFYFELTSFINRIVVQYRETKLTLLGCRRLHTVEVFQQLRGALQRGSTHRLGSLRGLHQEDWCWRGPYLLCPRGRCVTGTRR
jgi:hypothetical protein